MRCTESPEENMQKALRGIDECAEKGANIVALSELFLGPYFCQGKNDKYFDLAETIPGKNTDILCEKAKEKKIVIVASLYEKTVDIRNPAEGPKGFFNTAIVINPDGKIAGKYHKMHIPSLPPDLYTEDYYFEKGSMGFLVFETPYGKIAPLICYDQWFPEGARAVAAKGAEIIFYPTAIGWPAGAREDAERISKAEHEAWQIMQRSHAIANNVFVGAINRTGIEGSLKFWGTSFVASPYGEVLAKAGTDTEENIVVTCDLDMIQSMRKEWPFLDERRIKVENASSPTS
jgi:N-carbamoylputrescine amidase